MTPATGAGASKAPRSAQPAAQPATKAPHSANQRRASAEEPASAGGAKKKGARPTAEAADRTGKVARSPAAGARPLTPTSHAGAAPAHPVATVPGAAGAKGSGTKRAKAEATKAEKKPTTKETVKKAVSSPTSRTTKDARPSGATGAERAPAHRGANAAAAGPYAEDQKFLAEQRHLLESEREVYLAQASDLKAEADSLAQEREPGDVQFDEESGEGGTVTVDRERDLALSAQALAAVEEIDAALAKIAEGMYGACERCGQPIPKPRLKALPYARLCVACKSGGLSRR